MQTEQNDTSKQTNTQNKICTTTAKRKTKQTNLSIKIHSPPANWATSSTSSCKLRVSIRRPMKETLVVHFMPMTGGQLLC